MFFKNRLQPSHTTDIGNGVKQNKKTMKKKYRVEQIKQSVDLSNIKCCSIIKNCLSSNAYKVERNMILQANNY
ncbi:MAG: hypothetical protein GY821_11580 [Gammaproteobacteria bacterium]|nr:hypothetical protein [Gammaproteobacteria bacterium]